MPCELLLYDLSVAACVRMPAYLVLSTIPFDSLVKRIHITKRDLFYTDVKLFVDQAESDGVLDDVATMLGCTRSNLHVVASDKGLVVGRVQFEEDGGTWSLPVWCMKWTISVSNKCC